MGMRSSYDHHLSHLREWPRSEPVHGDIRRLKFLLHLQRMILTSTPPVTYDPLTSCSLRVFPPRLSVAPAPERAPHSSPVTPYFLSCSPRFLPEALWSV